MQHIIGVSFNFRWLCRVTTAFTRWLWNVPLTGDSW